MSLLLAERSLLLERMDQETLDGPTTVRILRALEQVNAWLGGVAATLYHVKQFSHGWKPGERIRFVDWGTGGADIPRALVRWGRKHGFSFEMVGVDNNGPVLDYARRACRDYPEITLVQVDIECFGVAPAKAGAQSSIDWIPASAGMTALEGPFDYALSSLCLHHLTDSQIVNLLKRSDRLARRGLIMNDLKRSARAWGWIWALTRLTGAHPIVQNDGPLSVRRAFSPEDLETYAQQAGLGYLRVKTHFGYRLTLAGEKKGPSPLPSPAEGGRGSKG